LLPKGTVALTRRVNVFEEGQIFADHEEMDQLFVNYFELRDTRTRRGIESSEIQSRQLPRLEQFRQLRDLERVFDTIGNIDHEFHAASWAKTWLGGPVIRVHRTRPILICGCFIGSCIGRLLAREGAAGDK
jgi:hypothetical protein